MKHNIRLFKIISLFIRSFFMQFEIFLCKGIYSLLNSQNVLYD